MFFVNVCLVSSRCSCRLHIFGITSEHSKPLYGPPYLHFYEEIYILMPSATFDTLTRPVLVHSTTFYALATPLFPKEVMYLNRVTFFIWVGRFFQFTVINQRRSTYKSSGRLLTTNQTIEYRENTSHYVLEFFSPPLVVVI
jgi:hypothetical protein